MSKFHIKVFLLVVLAILAGFTWFIAGSGDYISLANIQKSATSLKAQAKSHYLEGVLIFLISYICVNLWFPAAALLTLLAGFLYGTVAGTLYVDAAATICAILGFVISRNFVGNWVQHKWRKQLIGFNKELARRGHIYLLLVRLIPMMPYILINFLAGLTKVRLRTFTWTTALGSLPGIFIFSYSGRQLLSIRTVEDIFTPRVMLAFVLLGCFAGSVIVYKILTRVRGKGEEI